MCLGDITLKHQRCQCLYVFALRGVQLVCSLVMPKSSAIATKSTLLTSSVSLQGMQHCTGPKILLEQCACRLEHLQTVWALCSTRSPLFDALQHHQECFHCWLNVRYIPLENACLYDAAIAISNQSLWMGLFLL